MPVLSICNHKGGTGKTTSAIHLAAAYGTSGKRVLLIDLDPQGFLTRMLGASEPDEKDSALVLFDPHARADEATLITMPAFDLLPASYSMTRAARRLNKPTDVLWARESLAAIEGYDVIMLDTAAAMTVFSLNALVASDVCLIPVTPEYQPVVGAEQTYSTARLVQEKLNPRLKEPAFLLTQVDARKRDHAALSAFVRRSFGHRVLRTEIRTSASLAESASGGSTVFDRDLQSRGARDYANAADEIGELLFVENASEEAAPEMQSPPAAPPGRSPELGFPPT